MANKIKPEDYVFKFGKYKDMRAVDVAEIYKVDKDGNDVPIGLSYLEWLCNQDWFKHTEIIKTIIETAKQCMSEPEEEQKPEPKKKKEPKKNGVVKISTDVESKTVQF